MFLMIALVIACSASDCPINGPQSAVGPDVQAYTALKALPRPASGLRRRVGDGDFDLTPEKALTFRHDPLLTWAERQH